LKKHFFFYTVTAFVKTRRSHASALIVSLVSTWWFLPLISSFPKERVSPRRTANNSPFLATSRLRSDFRSPHNFPAWS